MNKEYEDINNGENIYHYKEKIEQEEKSLNNNKDITNRNKEIILNYCKYRKIKEHISNSRCYKLLNKIKLIAVKRKDFDKFKQKDVDDFLEDVDKRQDITQTTKDDYRMIFKKFFRWLGKENLIKDIKVSGKKKRRLPSEILDEKDVLKMLDYASSPRAKAIISLFADAGLRISELINLKIKNLMFNKEDDTIKLIVETGKTGGRSLILIPSVPYVLNYINSLPEKIKNNSDSFLFLKIEGGKYTDEQMTYASIGKLLKDIGKLADIKKPVNPHSFRRYSATSSSAFLSDSALMVRYGWTDRETINSYTFMNPTKADELYKQRYGKKEVEIKESELTPIKCSCGTINPPNSLCSNCGRPNTLKIAITREDEKQKEMQELRTAILGLSKEIKELKEKKN
ncbi:MAG: tyrosine-type recombinase/integrase [Nanoarchaeota archaeon]